MYHILLQYIWYIHIYGGHHSPAFPPQGSGSTPTPNNLEASKTSKAWNIDHVEGGRELFAMMCIDATRQMADGTM